MKKQNYQWLAVYSLLLGFTLFAGIFPVSAQENTPLPIGMIQGVGDDGSMRGKWVTLRGVVIAIQEDYSASSDTVFHTFYVQDLSEMADGDPQTSDGIAVFTGRDRPNVKIGDVVLVNGQVTEYFGLTEIDDYRLSYTVERTNHPLPDPVILAPPADNEASANYYEAYEGMRVAVAGEARVVGATYSTCGLAVVTSDVREERIIRRQLEDPIGQIIPVLYYTDISCDDFPSVKTGDHLLNLTGALTYSFDLFRIVQQKNLTLEIVEAEWLPFPDVPIATEGQFSIASFNVENYFDMNDDIGDPSAEPIPSEGELTIKQEKLAYTIGKLLACPTLVAIQEVEKRALLDELVAKVAGICDFTYNIHHMDSPDARGIDVALLSNPNRVTAHNMQLHQTCTRFDTDVKDETSNCTGLENPLFSRPPLQVDLEIDRQTVTVIVNHFKSKRGGEDVTALRRTAQAQHINNIVDELLDADPLVSVIVLGDFNDYDQSPSIQKLSERLVDAMAKVPAIERYSYIFSGASQQIDGIYVSDSLANHIAEVMFVHTNADYPSMLSLDTSPENIAYHSSDHDIPYLVLNMPHIESEETSLPLIEVAPEAISMDSDQLETTSSELENVAMASKELEVTNPALDTAEVLENETPETNLIVQSNENTSNRLGLGIGIVVLLLLVVGGGYIVFNRS